MLLFFFILFKSEFSPSYEMQQQEKNLKTFLIIMLINKQLPSSPDVVLTFFSMIQSVALVDRTSRPESISLLRVEELPEEPLERFNQLFTIREKWTEDDITPYIQ